MNYASMASDVLDAISGYAGGSPYLTQEGLKNQRKRIETALVEMRGAISLVIPCFPYKSKNRKDKVLSPRADLGEFSAIARLRTITVHVSEITGCPCDLFLAQDGFVFNHVDGIPDEEVAEYRSDLGGMIEHLNCGGNLHLEGLEHYMGDPHAYKEGRIGAIKKRLVDEFTMSNDQVDAIADRDENVNHRINQLERFAKGENDPTEGESKKSYRRRMRDMAKKVWALSEAWSDMISRQHPYAIRFSIHPYSDGSTKMPVRLVDTPDNVWRSPWMGSPVRMENSDRTYIVPKRTAESMGLRVVEKEGRPWCYRCAGQSLPSAMALA